MVYEILIEELKDVSTEEIIGKNVTGKILRRTELNESEAFKVKKVILKELKEREDPEKRKMLTVKRIPAEGEPYETNIDSLNGPQVNDILRQFLYTRNRVECWISEGGVVEFPKPVSKPTTD